MRKTPADITTSESQVTFKKMNNGCERFIASSMDYFKEKILNFKMHISDFIERVGSFITHLEFHKTPLVFCNSNYLHFMYGLLLK